jgi:hypothetical protein
MPRKTAAPIGPPPAQPPAAAEPPRPPSQTPPEEAPTRGACARAHAHARMREGDTNKAFAALADLISGLPSVIRHVDPPSAWPQMIMHGEMPTVPIVTALDEVALLLDEMASFIPKAGALTRERVIIASDHITDISDRIYEAAMGVPRGDGSPLWVVPRS